jgi:4-hydroxy 2-oxovalerate aldolase
MHMNQTFEKNYQIGQILEAIDSNIAQFASQPVWGYSMFYFLAASNDCHPSYVTYLMDKRTLSVNSINEILHKLEGEKKLLYDKKYIEALYNDYQNNEINDEIDRIQLSEALRGKHVLVLAPGSTIKSHRETIIQYMDEHPEAITISVNFLTKRIKPDFVFLSNAKRYVQLATKFTRSKYRIIATSNVTEMTAGEFEFKLNYSTLIDKGAEFEDHSMRMLVKTLIDAGAAKISFAGCDGYSAKHANYYSRSMEYDFVKNKVDYLNNYMRDYLRTVKDRAELVFVTPSHYGDL